MITPVANINKTIIKAKNWWSGHNATSTNYYNLFGGQQWNIRFDCIFTEAPTSWQFAFFEWSTSSAHTRRGIVITENGVIRILGMTSTGYVYLSAYDNRNICDGVPHHVYIYRNGATIYVEIDGIGNTLSNAYGTNEMVGTTNQSGIALHSWASSTISNSSIPAYYLWNMQCNASSTTTKGILIPGTEGASSGLYNVSSTLVFKSNSAGYWGTLSLPAGFKQS